MDRNLELKQEPVWAEATASTSFPLADVKDEPKVRELVPLQEDIVENIATNRRGSEDLLSQSVEGPPIGEESRRPHLCNECGRTFFRKDILMDHILTHTGDRLYSCRVCDTSFPTKSKLKRHMRTHSGERIFCNQCGGTFKGKTNFAKHMKDHSRERSYQCSQCERTFPTKKSMRRHKSSHSQDRTFDCNERGRSISRKDDLKEMTLGNVHTVPDSALGIGF